MELIRIETLNRTFLYFFYGELQVLFLFTIYLLSGSNARRRSHEERPAYAQQDRVMQRFRARNDVLMSQIDDMDHVIHDEDISSDDDDADVKSGGNLPVKYVLF